MAKQKRLSSNQLAVIDELFSGNFDEQAVLKKYKINRNTLNRWLADEFFDAELATRIASAHRQSEALIARYAPLAAAKLVQLTESEKEETARRACLDIITLPKLKAREKADEEIAEQAEQIEISDETAGKILAVLACDDNDMGTVKCA